MARVEFSQLDEFRQSVINSLSDEQIDLFLKSCAKELAARLLAKVIKRTPTGVYPNQSKVGGTLKRGWTGSAGVKNYVSSLRVNQYGGVYVIQIINPVEYASYVEYGHRTRDHRKWIKGKFMLTISEQELQANSRQILEAKLNNKLREVFR